MILLSLTFTAVDRRTFFSSVTEPCFPDPNDGPYLNSHHVYCCNIFCIEVLHSERRETLKLHVAFLAALPRNQHLFNKIKPISRDE